jgi:FkbM family methyltransferase
MKLLHRCIVTACRHSWRAYRYANITVAVDDLRVPIVGNMGLGNLKYRNVKFQLALKAALALRPEGYVIDMGANVGKFLLNLISHDRSKPYIGFEPLLPAAAYTRRLILDNGLTNHSIVAVALGEVCGIATIRFSSEADSSATLSDSMRPPSMYPHQQRIAISTADIQLADIPSIALVKLDVEGTELSVLRGMTTMIKRHRPPMLIEVMPYAYLLDGTYDRSYLGNLSELEAQRVAQARREHSLAVEAFLRDRDYLFYACAVDGEISAIATLDRGTSKVNTTDILVIPSETASAFMTEINRK